MNAGFGIPGLCILFLIRGEGNAPHPAVRVLEIKSMETLPKEPYPSHERQIQGQVALLEEFWGAPVFTLKHGDGTTAHTSLNFPELCRREVGMKIPDAPEEVSVEGWLLCLSMRDARAFGPYLPDGDALESLRSQAMEYWAAFQDVREGAAALNDIPYARGVHPLCVCCRFSSEVGLALTRAGVEAMQRKLSDHALEEEIRTCVADFFNTSEKHRKEESGEEAWYGDYLKWYTDDPEYFPEVDFIEKLLSELEDEDFRVIRIGEDNDDTDVRGTFWENPFDMELGRCITFA